MNMKYTTRQLPRIFSFGLGLALAVGSQACGDSKSPGDTMDATSDGGTSDGSNATTEDVSTGTTQTSMPTTAGTTGTSTGTTSSTSASTTDDCAFVCEDDMPQMNQCDPALQDCPDGEKCTPFNSMPGTCCVDATHCVPDDGNGQLGDDCMRLDGTDDCAKGLFCHPPTSGQDGPGVCISLCDPNDADSCDGVCFGWNGGVLPLCDVECDPLFPECLPKHGCYPVADTFVCIVIGAEDGGGQDGDNCEVVQGCQLGHACIDGANLSDCAQGSCCSPYCDYENMDPGACTGQGEECVSWWADPMMAPPNLQHVGICLVPM